MPCNMINQSVDSLTGLKKMAGAFFPYAEKQLGFDQSVDIIFQSDPDNAQNILGKTAQYDPDGMSITLFTDRRHPKDILRSLSHELVHHTQNCRGDFDSIADMDTSLGYAQKEGPLRDMEEEAYKLGNLIFRDWEDMFKQKVSQLQERKIRKTLRNSLKIMLNEVTTKVGGKAQVQDLKGMKILLVGDSHMKGSIGINLEKMLRARGATVVRAAQGASSSKYWNENVFGGKKYTNKRIINKWHWDSEGDREKLYRHDYDKIIVSFGGNESPPGRGKPGFVGNWKELKKARPGETDQARIKRLIPIYEKFRQERIIPFMKNLQSLGAPIEFFGLPQSKKKEAGKTPNPVGRALINGAYEATARELGINFHNMDTVIDDNPEFKKLGRKFGLTKDGVHYTGKAGNLYAKSMIARGPLDTAVPLHIKDPESLEPILDPETKKEVPYAYVPSHEARHAQWERDQKQSVASGYEGSYTAPTWMGPEKIHAGSYTDPNTEDWRKGPYGGEGRFIVGPGWSPRAPAGSWEEASARDANRHEDEHRTSAQLKQYLEDLKDIEVTTDAYNHPILRPLSAGLFGHKGHPSELMTTSLMPVPEWAATLGIAHGLGSTPLGRAGLGLSGAHVTKNLADRAAATVPATKHDRWGKGAPRARSLSTAMHTPDLETAKAQVRRHEAIEHYGLSDQQVRDLDAGNITLKDIQQERGVE